MDVVTEFSIQLEQVSEYEFRVKFDKPNHPDLKLDEPPPLGHDAGPSAGRILAAAIGNCLSASLLFCARRNGLEIRNIRTAVDVKVVRNESRRLRIGEVNVSIDPHLDEVEMEKFRACLGMFEDYCTVTQSVRQGIPINVQIQGAGQ